FMSRKREKLLTVVGIPNADPTVAVGAGEEFAVRTERDGSHPISMLLDFMEQFAIFTGINLHEPTQAAERDLALVRAHVGCDDGVLLFAHCGDLLAICDIPDDD